MAGDPTPNKAIPRFVGRYEVLLPIASGGMATVYLARARGAGGFERDVALKLTHLHLRESPEFQTLLVEEAKLVSAIHHNNIVSVLDVGDDALGLFLVMEYVEGDTLGGLVRKARGKNEAVPQRIAFRILLDALAGLHAAHEAKDGHGEPLHIVHRDFSPQNILVGIDGIARLTDFGIAKAASRVGHTSTGVVKGKVAYMAPEQARGSPIDRRADVWAAGVVAWEIIANRTLWPRDSEDVATLIKLVTTLPPRLSEIDPRVSPPLDKAVAKALTLAPEERWPTAAAFAKALAATVDVADLDETAAYVRDVAGPKIGQRHDQIRAMAQAQATISSIAEASLMTPSGRVLAEPSSHVRGPMRFDASSPLFPEGHPAERTASTDTTLSTDPRAVAPAATRKRLIVGIASAAAVFVLGGIVWAIAASHRSRDESTTAVATEARAMLPAPPAVSATAATSPAMTSAAPARPATSLPTRAVVNAGPTAAPATTAATVRTAAHTGAPLHVTPSATSKLAPSPY